jgi:hypothetical protein
MAEKPDDLTGRLAATLTPAFDDLSRFFTSRVAVGAALTAAAIIGHIASLIWQRTQPQAPAATEEAPAAAEPQEQPDYAVDEGFATSGGDELPSIGPRGVPQP